MEFHTRNVKRVDLLVTDFDTARARANVELCLHLQAFGRGRVGDLVYHDFVAHQGFSPASFG